MSSYFFHLCIHILQIYHGSLCCCFVGSVSLWGRCCRRSGEETWVGSLSVGCSSGGEVGQGVARGSLLLQSVSAFPVFVERTSLRLPQAFRGIFFSIRTIISRFILPCFLIFLPTPSASSRHLTAFSFHSRASLEASLSYKQ